MPNGSAVEEWTIIAGSLREVQDDDFIAHWVIYGR